VSLWLNMTKWEKYLASKDLAAAAQLINLPEERKLLAASNLNESLRLSLDLTAEWELLLLLALLNCLIKQLQQSLNDKRVNIFNKHKVNSFLYH
jgi:hypothetical protein